MTEVLPPSAIALSITSITLQSIRWDQFPMIRAIAFRRAVSSICPKDFRLLRLCKLSLRALTAQAMALPWMYLAKAVVAVIA